jgi:hypothetical protein
MKGSLGVVGHVVVDNIAALGCTGFDLVLWR